MKANQVRKKLFTPACAGVLLITLMCCADLFAREECVVTLNTCPETFMGDTVIVPADVIALSNVVRVCASSVLLPSSQPSRPSIVFVIDNSGSMGISNDSAGTRFAVTQALLDTIYKIQPQAEVGLVVYNEHLFFDPTTTQYYYSKYFTRLSASVNNDGVPNQAYLPFMTLDSTYDGKKGVLILKDILALTSQTRNAGGLTYTFQDLVYKPNFTTVGETNINVAFQAAREAFANAKNSRNQQFVIFLSDGAAAGAFSMGLPANEFVKGTNVPTTFTVYFTKATFVPPTLDTMTQNIAANNYSATNPKSDLWAINTNFNALLSLFTNNILNNLLYSVPIAPVSMTMNGGIASTDYRGDSVFVFPDSFPLTNLITPFSLGIKYQYNDTVAHTTEDTTVYVPFFIKQQVDAPVPAGFLYECHPAPLPGIPVTATLLDTSGDGHLDKIDLTWTDDSATIKTVMPAVGDFIGALHLNALDNTIDSLHAAAVVPDLVNKTIHVILTENTGTTLETGWLSAEISLKPVVMSLDNQNLIVTRVEDGAGPVIVNALLYPSTQNKTDTLRIKLSEPVTWKTAYVVLPSLVFHYFRPSGEYTGAFANLIQSDMTVLANDRVQIILPEGRIPAGFLVAPGLDSLQLIPAVQLYTDNMQNTANVLNRKVCIQYGIENVVEIVPPLAPFVPGSQLQSSDALLQSQIVKAQNYYSNVSHGNPYGTIVALRSIVRPLKQQTDGSFGSAAIYDAVGNRVVSKLRVDCAKPGTCTQLPADYGIFWDGRNANGRFVGGGTYLMVVSVTDINNAAFQRRVKIGVRRAVK